MKAAISIFVVFLVAAFFLLTSDQKEKGVITPAVTTVNNPAISTAEENNLTSIQWLDSVQTFGKIKSGEKVEISYRFKNTGEKQLVISSVIVSCGCTVAEKPVEPIAPGEVGVIKAEFNSTGRLGTNHKTITVHSNTPGGTSTLSFTVEVAENI